MLNVERGESVNSLDTWARKFGKNWTKSKVRRFFDLLEKDSMIVTKSETVTTRLSVCKYDSYQGKRNADETQVERKRNADETQVTPNNNDNNSNKDNNDKDLIDLDKLNQEQLNQEQINKLKEIIKKHDKPKPPKPKIEFIELGEFENIKIEKDNLEKLKESYSTNELDWMIKKLGSWLVGKKKTVKNYKSLKAYFVNWVENSYKEQKQKQIQNKDKHENYNKAMDELGSFLGLDEIEEPTETETQEIDYTEI